MKIIVCLTVAVLAFSQVHSAILGNLLGGSGSPISTGLISGLSGQTRLLGLVSKIVNLLGGSGGGLTNVCLLGPGVDWILSLCEMPGSQTHGSITIPLLGGGNCTILVITLSPDSIVGGCPTVPGHNVTSINGASMMPNESGQSPPVVAIALPFEILIKLRGILGLGKQPIGGDTDGESHDLYLLSLGLPHLLSGLLQFSNPTGIL